MINKLSEKITNTKYNQRPRADQCELCKQQFNLMHKQHECKRCSRAICYYCGQEKTIIPAYDSRVPHRTCKDCREDQQAQRQIIENNKCAFGQLSDIGKRWIKIILGDKVNIDQIISEYEDNIQVQVKNASSEIKGQIQQNLLRLYKELKQGMNYSLIDWHYYATLKESDNNIFNKISRVLTAFFNHTAFPKVNKNIVLITLFILYFCNEAIALQVLIYLHTQILPQRFQYIKADMDSSIQGQTEYLIQVYKDSNPQDKNERNIRKFFDTFSIPTLTTLMIYHVTFQVSYYLFNQLLVDKEFYNYEKLLAFICKKQLPFIQEPLNQELILSSIIKTTTLDQYIHYMAKDQENIAKRQSIQRSSIIKDNQQTASRSGSFRPEEDENSQKVIEGLLVYLNDGTTDYVDLIMKQLRSEKSKLQLNELIGTIRNKKEKFENQKKEYLVMKSKYEESKHKEAQAQEIEKQLLINLDGQTNENQDIQDKKQEEQCVQEVQQQQQIEEQQIQEQTQIKDEDQNNQEKQIEKSRSQSQSEISDQIIGMQKELDRLRFENNELMIALQKSNVRVSIIEKTTKEKQQQQQEQYISKLLSEKQQLLLKIKESQELISEQQLDIQFKVKEIESLKKQTQETVNNNEEQSQLNSEQNEIIQNLNKQIDQYQIQIEGFKRRNAVEQQMNNHTTNNDEDIVQTLTNEQQQLRNTILIKERELYSLKFQFVGINQKKIKISQQIQILEQENKEIKNKLSNLENHYSQTDTKKLTDYYETKIDLLQQTHQEQMNRLLFQQNDHQETIQKKENLLPVVSQKDKEVPKEQQMVQDNVPEDECIIF